jgi:hypothetical protein
MRRSSSRDMLLSLAWICWQKMAQILMGSQELELSK